MNDKYILTPEGNPIAEPDLMKWATWFEGSRDVRVVKKDTINNSRISTVFLGLDHAWGDTPPILWETLVFEGKLDQEMDRCGGNREQAEAMHARP